MIVAEVLSNNRSIHIKSVEENSTLWRTSERIAPVAGCRVGIRELQAVLLEAEEDHLGVALIQPGGSRYEQMK